MKSSELLDAEEEIERLEGLVDILQAKVITLKQEHSFLREHLKFWKDSGVPAPNNELQSIQVWLATLGRMGAEETANIMRNRLLLLMGAAEVLHNEGSTAEDKAGIYENRPDLRIET